MNACLHTHMCTYNTYICIQQKYTYIHIPVCLHTHTYIHTHERKRMIPLFKDRFHALYLYIYDLSRIHC